MELLFSKRQNQLSDILAKARQEEPAFHGFTHFVKGDISGIQDYIFNVKSERAARVLKGRSFYIQMASELCIVLIRQELGKDNVRLLYNGGGNFYLFARGAVETALEKVQEVIARDCSSDEYYLSLSWHELEKGGLADFGQVWQAAQRKSNRDKLAKFSSFWPAFEPYHFHGDKDDWLGFTQSFIGSGGFSTSDAKGAEKKVYRKGAVALGLDFRLGEGQGQFKGSLINQLPAWTPELLLRHENIIKEVRNRRGGKDNYVEPAKGHIIEFEYLAAFAGSRTGTDKLGVLKMDVDNLGTVFRSSSGLTDTSQLSAAIQWFFDSFMLELLSQSFSFLSMEKDENGQPSLAEASEPFVNNLYVVFSGGDDCFLLGGWDAVFAFAGRLRQEFGAFIRSLEQSVPALRDHQVTLSAGLLVVGPRFPVVRLAELAEESIGKAKSWRDGTGYLAKDRICVLGQVLSWEEFGLANKTAVQLRDLVLRDGASRAVLERIKRSAVGFEKAQQRAVAGSPASVWRLFYFLRNVKQGNLRKMEAIIQDYAKALLSAFNDKNAINPMAFVVAARWAEFLTRK